MAAQLQIGMMAYRSELRDYQQLTLARNPDEVERLARGIGLRVTPFAIMYGYNQYWVCTDRDINHPDVGYAFAGYYYGGVQ